MPSAVEIAREAADPKARILAILKANKSKNFVDRVVNAPKYPDMPTPGGKPGERSTHLMAYATDDKGAFVFPTVAYDPKTKALFVPKDPIKHALDNDELIRFKDEAEADWFTKNYKLGMAKNTQDMSTEEALDTLMSELQTK